MEKASLGLPDLKTPYLRSVLADKITPVLAFERLRASSPYAFLFESSESDSRLARFSILGVDPIEVLLIHADRLQVLSRQSNGSFKEIISETGCDPLAFLSERSAHLSKITESASAGASYAALPFEGGYVGYFGYGASKFFDNIKQQSSDPLAVPDGVFALYDSAIVFDHKERQMRVISFRGKEHSGSLIAAMEDSRSGKESLSSFAAVPADPHSRVQAAMKKQEFIDRVLRCKEFIAEGQVFQIVLAQRFAREYKGDPFCIYRALQSINPSPYGYYLQFPDFVYLGASPERLLACRNGELSLTALAGTRPRGRNEEEEKELEHDLRSSEKELAEHYMLVDLGRNDLGRVAEIGSVSWGEIARVTRYGQVMHLSTDISARLQKGLTCFDALRSCFPAGTVSGAPKIRAMELLADLEPEKRGIYSGMVGYFDFKGNSDSAIAIRSAVVKNSVAHINAGAGIVQDSEPEAEYEETRNKALSVLKAICIAEEIQL